MTCAKKVVRCVIISPSGRAYEGENWCDEPQEVCPREPGEGYEKCKSICHQTNHAEINALFAAGTDANGATAFLHGHHHYCKACQLALFSAGIKSLAVPIE